MSGNTIKLTFLGSGSAFTIGENNFQSNILVQDTKGQDSLLIDCGTDVRLSLYNLGFNHLNINNVYISHLHSDHIGGMEWLALASYFDPSASRPNLFLPEDIKDEIWNNSLSGGLSTLQGQKASLSTFFDVHGVPPNSFFKWQNIKFELIQMLHVTDNHRIMPCYGLMFKAGRKVIFFTSDAQLAYSHAIDYYKQADIIFHDCETAPFKSGVHAHYSDLKTLPEEIKAKIWLYHFNPGPKPKPEEDGFLGFVQPGQEFHF